jgi:predicted transcriptional regulator with HTH domain
VRHFLLPIVLVSLGSADIERAILQYLNSHYPLSGAEYVCELTGAAQVQLEFDSVSVEGFGKENPGGQTTARLNFQIKGERIKSSAIGVRIGILKQVLVASQPIGACEKIDEPLGIRHGIMSRKCWATRNFRTIDNCRM